MSGGVDFTRRLVKGRIAETVFAQMFRQEGRFTVLEFGYEKIIPELVQNGNTEENEMIETLRTAPDFAVISREHKTVRLIEVKYRKTLTHSNILKIAKRMHDSWNPSYLFVASLDGFYFDEIKDIIDNEGDISPLETSYISEKSQKQYLEIIRDFESAVQ